VAKRPDTGRINQRHRTRKDLLAAAAQLLKAGRRPDMDEVAAAAMVSRATAYRYFPSVEALLVEAPIDGAAPDPADVFAGDRSTDPAARADRAEAALHEMCYRNEAQLRLMLAASLGRASSGGAADGGTPVRQNRRTPLIEAALAPARGRFAPAAYEKLCAALALVFGPEAMIVFRDVLAIDEKAARKVKSWAVRALVRAAVEESAAAAAARADSPGARGKAPR
jgi:AcrR family transcriptional regulator